MTKKQVLVIQCNNTVQHEICPLCLVDFKPNVGGWPFLNGEWGDPICEDCWQEWETKGKPVKLAYDKSDCPTCDTREYCRMVPCSL